MNIQYKVHMHNTSYKKANKYLNSIISGDIDAGYYLRKSLLDINIHDLSVDAFIEILVNTKTPQIFAESDICGDGSDWNSIELSILGDISITLPATIYDNGRHNLPEQYDTEIYGTLMYVAGALLRNDNNKIPADWNELVRDGEIDVDAYKKLYNRRLLPLLSHANKIAEAKNKFALITIPGIGCGQFSGQFSGQVGELLKTTLIWLLKKYNSCLKNIKVVYYDPYNECKYERHELGCISFLVRPLIKGDDSNPQLCRPSVYEVCDDDDFSQCELFSIVAWDHVSWPGNDFYIGARSTDDGVKSAATNSMKIMTGFDGKYDKSRSCYKPIGEYINWKGVVIKNNIKLQVKDNLTLTFD